MGKFKQQMKIAGQLRQATRDFQRGMQILQATDDLGKVSLVLTQLVPQLENVIPGTKVKVSKLMLEKAGKDYKKAYKKGGVDKVRELIQSSLNRPEFMKLLDLLELTDTHLWLTAEEATGEKIYAD